MKYLVSLHKIPGVGSLRLNTIIQHFDSPEAAWHAKVSDYIQCGISEALAENIASWKEKINPDEVYENLQNENINVLQITDEHYPTLLKEIPDAPPLLYYKGDLAAFSRQMISVVGSRKFSAYGRQAAYSISRDIAAANITVVSGLAYGIDAISHRAALDAGGTTVAVQGNSLEEKYISPAANQGLAQDILDNGGLLLSEFAPETSASPGTFPARNRIIAGLSLGTLVVEATADSGSLITARWALEFNRDVFAVPGSIFTPQQVGPNNLIRSGAKLVQSAQDILNEIGANYKFSENYVEYIPENEEEKAVLSVLSPEPLHIDNIIKLTKLKAANVLSLLTILEMNQAVKDVGGQNYIRL